MQNIKIREFRGRRSNTNTRICFEVRTTALCPRLHTEGFSLYVSKFAQLRYVPVFTQKDFHYVHTEPSTKGPPLRNYNSTLGVYYSSLKCNHLYTRGIDTKPNHNRLYTRGIRHKAKAQSPLHKKDKAQCQSSNTITSAQEG